MKKIRQIIEAIIELFEGPKQRSQIRTERSSANIIPEEIKDRLRKEWARAEGARL